MGWVVTAWFGGFRTLPHMIAFDAHDMGWRIHAHVSFGYILKRRRQDYCARIGTGAFLVGMPRRLDFLTVVGLFHIWFFWSDGGKGLICFGFAFPPGLDMTLTIMMMDVCGYDSLDDLSCSSSTQNNTVSFCYASFRTKGSLTCT